MYDRRIKSISIISTYTAISEIGKELQPTIFLSKMTDTNSTISTHHSPLHSQGSASPSNSLDSTNSIDPALLDEEENPLEEGIADNVIAPSKQSYAIGGGGYNALKTHKGQLYSGMAVGGSHTWNYDAGTWKETKEEPDLWRIDYQTTKRRARNAPKGSGAPVGTEYHWLIVGHQVRNTSHKRPGGSIGINN